MRLIVRAQAKLAPSRLVKVRDRVLARARRPPVTRCGWSHAQENATGQAQAGGTLRRSLYPYRCALAISNGTDSMTPEAFHEFHAFVNRSKTTVLGDGLGLEVGGSYWVWSERKYVSLYYGSPDEPDLRPSPQTDRFRELGRLGWLDTLHGFGAWSKEWMIDRDRMRFALDRPRELGMKTSVYANHGGFNIAHNIAGPWGYYQKGGIPRDHSYCLDLLRDFGSKYYWNDAFYELDRYGEHQVIRSQPDLDRAVATHDLERYFTRLDHGAITRNGGGACAHGFHYRGSLATWECEFAKPYA